MYKRKFNTNILAWILLLSLSCIWGSSYILLKKALYVFQPIEVTHLRIVTAALVFLPYSIPQLFRLTSLQYVVLGLEGLLGTLFPLLFFAIAQLHINSGIHGVLNSITPVFVLLVGFCFFKMKILKTQVLGILLSMGGTIFLMITESSLVTTGFNYYILLSLLACFLYGNSAYLIKYYLHDLKSTTIASVPLLLLALISGIYLLLHPAIFSKITTHPAGKNAFLWVIIAGTINLGVGNLVWAALSKIASPLFTSTESLLTPLVSLSLGIMDQEKLLWEHYLAGAIILLGIYFLNKPAKPT